MHWQEACRYVTFLSSLLCTVDVPLLQRPLWRMLAMTSLLSK